MKNCLKSFLFLLGVSICSLFAFSQNQKPQVQLGAQNIALNQHFTIQVTLTNVDNAPEPVFPELPGFQKLNVERGSQYSVRIVNGSRTSSQTLSFTCYYKPEKEGTYNFSNLELKVQGQVYSLTAFQVNVGAAQQASRRRSMFDDFFNDPFFNRSRSQPQYDYSDVSSGGQLIINSDKRTVYKGEPIHMEVDFIIPIEKEQYARPSIKELREIEELMMSQRPNNCWEEVIPFDEKTVVSEIEIKGKKFKKYRLFEAVYYPINAEPVTFKSVAIKLNAITKISKQQDRRGNHRGQTSLKEFKANQITVKVKELPEHPLKDKVAVGNYYLSDNLDSTTCSTGSAIKYKFNIRGEGNVNAINDPTIIETDGIEILNSNSNINMNKGHGHVTGEKKMEYFIIPQEPNEYQVADLFEFIYFNFQKEKYDTLRSKEILTVEGKSRLNDEIAGTKFNAFYDLINTADDTLESRDKINILQLSSNILTGSLLVCSIGVFIYKRRRKDRDG